ncbi:DUF5710 domain-containing protein [Cupriavidus sp. TMH.W2]|uniref:DUF5710 domain-containing protein n=1 Tax=Cupriavidus sp. TMH.W2 TaxID=3434465 RepID=UPI003D770AF9
MQPRIQWGHHARFKSPVVSDFATLVNPHILITGGTGAGKTHQLRTIISQIIGSAGNRPPRIHIFDIHGDIRVDDASEVMFSEQSDFGLNPLRIGADPHFGGPRRAINGVLKTLDKTGYKLGDKQRACLRNILNDVYEEHGIRQDDPSTWVVDESESRLLGGDSGARLYLNVPREEKDDAKAFGARWDRETICWWVPVDEYVGGITRWPPKTTGRTHPSLDDALRFARRKYLESFIGADKEAVTQLERVNAMAANLRRKTLQALKAGNRDFRDEEAEAELDKLKQRAVDTFKEAVTAIKTGTELDDITKYDSTEVLKGVIDRLENLIGIGVFKPKRPPFDPTKPVWRYNLRPLDLESRKLFVHFLLRDMFLKALERGETQDLVELLLLDEGKAFIDDEEDNILLTLAREVRKFGTGMICASQSPTHFPDDFNAAMGTKVMLRIDESFWKTAARKMLLPEEQIRAIIPRKTCLIQRKEAGKANGSEWVPVELGQPTEARRMEAVG